MAESAQKSTIVLRRAEAAARVSEDSRALLRAIRLNLADLPASARPIVEALAREVISLRQRQDELVAQLEKAETLADHDPLCPVFNRRAFERELSREIALAERFGTPLSLIFIDLDRFKLVNDRFGHATGDTVIQFVARTLIEQVRQTDIVGRLGGDEFGIALTHAGIEDSQAKAMALEAAIDGLTVRDREDKSLEPVRLGASCGIVEWRRGQSATALIAQADESMFLAKNEKKRAR